MGLQLVDVVLAEQATRTSAYTKEFEWLDAKMMVTVRIPVAPSATPTITPFLQAYDPGSQEWFTIWTATSAQSPTAGTERYTYIFTDTAFLPSGFTEAKQVYLPPRMRFGMTHADADSVDYTVAALRVNSNNLGI